MKPPASEERQAKADPPPPGSRASARARMIRRRRRSAGTLAGVLLLAIVLGIMLGSVAHGRRPRRRLSSRHGATPSAQPVASRSLAAREAAAVQRVRARLPIVRMAGEQHREIALTFDDGPGPYTPAILRVLTRTHTPATFFEVGEELRYFSASTAVIVRHGDVIGDHTWSHPNMAGLSARRQRTQILREAAVTGDQGAPFPHLYRPPYGRWNATTLRLLKARSMLMVLWSVDTGDWQRPGSRKIVHRALAGARPGAIILMHDGGGDRSETVRALPRIIHDLRREGYRLVTVPRLLLDNPPPRRQDVGAVRGQGA